MQQNIVMIIFILRKHIIALAIMGDCKIKWRKKRKIITWKSMLESIYYIAKGNAFRYCLWLSIPKWKRVQKFDDEPHEMLLKWRVGIPQKMSQPGPYVQGNDVSGSQTAVALWVTMFGPTMDHLGDGGPRRCHEAENILSFSDVIDVITS